MSRHSYSNEVTVTDEMRAEVLRVRAEIAKANKLLLSAWHRFDTVGDEIRPAILASSGVSLAAERLQALYRREADAEERLRKAYSSSTNLRGTELQCLMEIELAQMN